MPMRLKKTKESSTGLNTEFKNLDSGRTVSLEHVKKQIQNGNTNYKDYSIVKKTNGTEYVRSKPDGKKNNNIE